MRNWMFAFVACGLASVASAQVMYDVSRILASNASVPPMTPDAVSDVFEMPGALDRAFTTFVSDPGGNGRASGLASQSTVADIGSGVFSGGGQGSALADRTAGEESLSRASATSAFVLDFASSEPIRVELGYRLTVAAVSDGRAGAGVRVLNTEGEGTSVFSDAIGDVLGLDAFSSGSVTLLLPAGAYEFRAFGIGEAGFGTDLTGTVLQATGDFDFDLRVTVVPAPAAGVLLAGAAVFSARRRRS